MSEQATAPAKTSGSSGGLLFSTLGVLIVFAILVGIFMISRAVPLRMDFTDNKVHTLSEGSKNILSTIDTPIDLKFFVSQESDTMPPDLNGRVREVEAMLMQYVAAAPDDMVRIRKYDPEPDSEEEDAALLAGIQSQPTRQGDLYFGVSVSSLDKKANLDFIPNIPEELFEYELSRAITQVKSSKKRVVGVMSAIPLQGGMGGGGMPFQQQQQPQRPWVFYTELQKDYEVRSVPITSTSIDEDLDALILVHPAGISEDAQFAVDQYLMKGKSLVVFLDPHSIATRMTSPPPNPQNPTPPPQTASNLEKLLETWGYKFDSSQVVADMLHKTPLAAGRESPAVLSLSPESFNEDDVITSRISDMMMVFTGAFTGEPAEGLTSDVLISSSKQNEMVNPQTAETDDQQIVSKFRSSGKEKALALRLTGKFKSAFPDGGPADEDGKKPEEGEDEGGSLKESKDGASVFLVGDTDLVYDQFSVRQLRFGGMAMAQPVNQNLAFALNAIDQVAGDSNLVQIRSRGSSRRPFTRINEIETEANDNIQGEIDKLEAERNEAQQRINELQANKDPKQQFMMSPAQAAELKSFRESNVAANKRIRELKKEARKDINSTLATIKWMNILLVPIVVFFVGIFVAVIRKAKTSAK